MVCKWAEQGGNMIASNAEAAADRLAETPCFPTLTEGMESVAIIQLKRGFAGYTKRVR